MDNFEKSIILSTEVAMPRWGEIFADAGMQTLRPNPEFVALLPEFKKAGCRQVLDAGCGAGRHLIPLLEAGFQVTGVDVEAAVLQVLKGALASRGLKAPLVQADLRRLPLRRGAFDLALSINVINHGDAAAFRNFCRELDRGVRPGGQLFIYVSPRDFAARVILPQTRQLEPGTLVDIATPDGNLVHHFPTPEELGEQLPGYNLQRFETILAPIPFMNNAELPQLIFWGQKV
jgi:SAM-dependent methyltransferase